ncbi:MAG: ATP synthase F1 subunit delta [Acidimicrobiia bacterium]|nr:ATP synthase F1 subunit delta [Acidimicrobiia bacterium]
MRDETVARNYAEALMTLGERHEGIEAYGALIEALDTMLSANPRLRQFLETPRIDTKEKKAALVKAFGPNAPRPFLNFVLVTIDKHRQRLLRKINEEYQLLLDERLGRQRVEVTVAREMGDAGVDLVASQLSKILGKTAIPKIRVRPEILGGIVIKTGDRVFDGSVRHKMERLRKRMLGAPLPAAVGGVETTREEA